MTGPVIVMAKDESLYGNAGDEEPVAGQSPREEEVHEPPFGTTISSPIPTPSTSTAWSHHPLVKTVMMGHRTRLNAVLRRKRMVEVRAGARKKPRRQGNRNLNLVGRRNHKPVSLLKVRGWDPNRVVRNLMTVKAAGIREGPRVIRLD